MAHAPRYERDAIISCQHHPSASLVRYACYHPVDECGADDRKGLEPRPNVTTKSIKRHTRMAEEISSERCAAIQISRAKTRPKTNR